MYLILLSLIAILIVFYLFLVLFFKCKMPFWSKQPVFHWYNLMYWLGGPPGLMIKDLPVINKYVDLFNIKTFSLTDYESEGNKEAIETICEFIKKNYIYTTNQGVLYTPNKSHILDYLINSNHPGYFTLYQEPKMLLQTETSVTDTDIIAVISARPLYVRLNKKSLFKKEKIMFTTYYVDNLCVQPAYRKKGIASTMIQTHYYNLRQKNKQINTCLFKREGDLNAIVPLTAFKTYCLNMAQLLNTISINTISIVLPIQYSLIEIGVNQLHLCIDFIKSQMANFSCVILPDVTSLAHLIKTENLKIYCLLAGANAMGANGIANGLGIVACYIFRLMDLTYDNEKACECIATINTIPTAVFQQGFLQASKLLKEKQQITLILLEETAHASQILSVLASHIALASHIKFTSPTAFFFYNYACYSIKSQKCLIVY
jgi:hypothetical protein